MAVIRVPALRHETQLGTFDELRILMDHGPPDVLVYVAYRVAGREPTGGSIARQSNERRWEFAINFDGGRPDAEYWVYMFRRSPPSTSR